MGECPWPLLPLESQSILVDGFYKRRNHENVNMKADSVKRTVTSDTGLKKEKYEGQESYCGSEGAALSSTAVQQTEALGNRPTEALLDQTVLIDDTLK